MLRTRVLAGLATVIPLWVTWVIVSFVFNTMRSVSQPFIEHGIEWIVQSSGRQPKGILAYVDWAAPVVAVLLTLFSLYLLGLFSANVLGRRVVNLVERLFEGLPLVKTIYGSTKRIILTLAGGNGTQHFQKVVLVEFPRPGMKCIAFLTSVIKDTDTGRLLATVFISTTPNPTTGYMQILPLEDVSETGWTVEEAVKVLMSGGILSPPKIPFDQVQAVQWEPPADSDATRVKT
ncbi:MAG TPA: DUF502 domain-containing protein [Phycisphaerae bacterium]|nr:DUF502 domain-containing protein [Phycisphaerae bacterium]